MIFGLNCNSPSWPFLRICFLESMCFSGDGVCRAGDGEKKQVGHVSARAKAPATTNGWEHISQGFHFLGGGGGERLN